MHPEYFGDSYDLVKRFFIQELKTLGYTVTVQPMFTGTWGDQEQQFFELMGASRRDPRINLARSALFIDPDTGINEKGGKAHVSFKALAEQANSSSIVFAFDQSFSRQMKPIEMMQEKLRRMEAMNCHAMYYDSHARFLFISMSQGLLQELKTHLHSVGLPTSRLVESAA
ncbi:MAG TPA: hypothetical protein PKX47_12375 [Smithellaceae bacterium]|nr:hypothetical protein [Smithellaceae bacterium]